MENTPNYNMNLPDYEDFADVEKLNENFEIIDTQMKSTESELTTHVNDNTKHLAIGDKNKIDGALQKNGDTMTGDLLISKGIPAVKLRVPNGSTTLDLYLNASDNANFGAILKMNEFDLLRFISRKDIRFEDYDGIWTSLADLKSYVSNGKSLIANAITQMGVPTATNAEFATMSANISAINPGLKKAGGITTAQNTLDIPAGTFDFTPKMIVTHSSVSNDTFYSVYYAADFMYPGSPQVGYTISRYNGGTNSAGISATIRHGGFIIITTPGYDTYARNASWVALG